MKLNPDCIRDVMLYFEENLLISVYGFVPISRLEIFKRFQGQHSYEDILYSLIQLHESGYIVTDFKTDIPKTTYGLQSIFYITPKGHEFIAAIQSEESWKTKIIPIIKTFGSVSLSVIEAVAKGAMNAVLEKTILPLSNKS